MRLLPAIFLMLLLSIAARAQTKAEEEVRKILQDQSEAWNKGDLSAYMESYWHSDSLLFIGKKGVVYGWQKTRSNYEKAYPDTVSMGKLQFGLVEVKRLSEVFFFVVGKWKLTRAAGNLEGHFSLLIKKINGKWVIVADHSS
ncbi:MAG: DUF4440 domain-containing protein [Chitinophagaceae bacterium]|nr:DUF4440 domain-containing protein [Bacteroidota bacterium]MCC6258327.1 DUF4440 domain-containing protein [Chitinophagaceae bacterium]MCW5916806.1 DUF4440 domain-containing protein [Ferruginibacter sp.]